MGISKDLLVWAPAQVLTQGNLFTSDELVVSDALDVGLLISVASLRSGGDVYNVPEVTIWSAAKDAGDDYWFPIFRLLTQIAGAVTKNMSGAYVAGNTAITLGVALTNPFAHPASCFVKDTVSGNHEFCKLVYASGTAVVLADGLAYDHGNNTPMYFPESVNRIPLDLVVDGAKRLKATVRNPLGANGGDLWFEIVIVTGEVTNA